MQLVVGKKYVTALGQNVEIFSEPRSNMFLGVITLPISGVIKPMLWDGKGQLLWGDNGSENIVNEMIPGIETWAKLDLYEKDAVRRICEAFRDKKITGVRILRATYGWGLLEAKNIIERVNSRELR